MKSAPISRSEKPLTAVDSFFQSSKQPWDGPCVGFSTGALVGSTIVGDSDGAPLVAVQHSGNCPHQRDACGFVGFNDQNRCTVVFTPHSVGPPVISLGLLSSEFSLIMINPKSMLASLETKQFSSNVTLPLPSTERTPNGAPLPLKTQLSSVSFPPTFEITANNTEFPTKEQLRNDADIDGTVPVIPESGMSGSVGKLAVPL
ncbi:hypothetical protein MHU86_10498 [Fragilaria crotonensis]|nr:hypothetical protein MHU86_10498 [Fragilaria crotonensis]